MLITGNTKVASRGVRDESSPRGGKRNLGEGYKELGVVCIEMVVNRRGLLDGLTVWCIE